MKAYEELLEISEQLRNIQRALYLLAWDERTYMPKGAVEGRSETKAELSQLYQQKLTSERTKEVLDELNKESVQAELDEVEKAAVREMTRDFEKRYRIPDELVKEISRTTTRAQSAWEEAREKSDFEHFLPHLEDIVELKKESAEYIGYENEPYDALIDQFEPGFTAKKIKKIFDPMKRKLASLIDDILSKEMEPGKGVFEGKTFSIKKQKKLCRKIAEEFGYDFDHGRMDEAVHPFTIGMDDDVRITNRYTEENITSLFSLMHETGHGLYEQGIKEEWYGHPLGKRISSGYHESQSRMWENFVGRSMEFIEYIYPEITDTFPQLKGHSGEEFYRRINRVERNPIRVDADEATYNLHIALRFDIELGLFRGEIEPEETITVWRNKMDDYLGIVPEDPSNGVLQDVHWSVGQFGYFPSYGLGNLFAAQIYNTVEQDIDGLGRKISQGNFDPLREWLRENIHEKGRMYKAQEMTKRVTGEKLNEDYHIEYLEKKYGPIYDI